MTTLTDDLATATLWAKGRGWDVVHDDVMVHLNIEHRLAICIEPQFTEDGKLWFANVTEWDETGGVNMEIPLSESTFTAMTEAVVLWRNTWEEQQRELAQDIEHDEDVYWSGTGELMSDDSYIDYLNSH